MRDVAVIGVGETEFGELWDRSFRDLGIEAGLKAIQDAKLRSEDIDAVYIGNMSAGKFIDQEHVSALVADYAGLADMHLPTVRVEGGGACGAIALLQARLAIASGMYDIVVVGGAEKMTDVGEVQAAEILSSTADQEWETVFGATFAGLYAMMARRHMYEYGTTREQMAAVAVKNHKNGALNPEAQFQKEITLETVLQAPWVAEPLGLFDCAPLSDGAAAVVLREMQKARKFTDTPIRIAGSGQASDFLALHDRRDPRDRGPPVCREGERRTRYGGRRHRVERQDLRQHIRRPEGAGSTGRGDGRRASGGDREAAPRTGRQTPSRRRAPRADAHPGRHRGHRGRPHLRAGGLRWPSLGSGGRFRVATISSGRSAGAAARSTSLRGPCARRAVADPLARCNGSISRARGASSPTR